MKEDYKKSITNKISLDITDPDLLKEWDYDKNQTILGIMPKEITRKSSKKVFWLCPKCGNSYLATSAARTGYSYQKGTACPFCAGKHVIVGKTDLKSQFPLIAAEWDYERNQRNPDEVLARGHYNAYWICSKGHSYQMDVSSRTRTDGKANGCPYCANKKVLKGFNDLETLYPDVVKHWDYSKNEKLPSEYVAHTDKKVWWLCEKGHSYYSKICDKTKAKPTGCPYCANQKLLVGFNDLETKFPDLAKEWNYEKNETTPRDHVAGTHKKVWWICQKCGHSYYASIKERAYHGTSCPNCTHYYKTSTPEQAVFYYVKKSFPDAINSYKPEFLRGMEVDVFIPSLSLGIEYDGSIWHDNKKKDARKSALLKDHGIKLIRIREGKNQENQYSDLRIIPSEYVSNLEKVDSCIVELLSFIDDYYHLKLNYDIDAKRDSAEIYKLSENIKKKKSLQASNSPVLVEWNYEKNGIITPDKVTPASNKVFWWKCSKCGKEWQQSIKTKMKGGLYCESCSKSAANNEKSIKRIVAGKVESVADIPRLLAEWNDPRDPKTVTKGSDYKANWKCSVCGNEFSMRVRARTKMGKEQGCPKCGRLKSLHSRTRRVINLDTNEVFENCVEAGKAYSLSPSHIAAACRGKMNKAGGYRWKYSD